MMEHQVIDADRWPGVARRPGSARGARAEIARRALARACSGTGVRLIVLDDDRAVAVPAAEDGEPVLTVTDRTVFARIAESDWLGLAEGYLAGEWTADDLPAVLGALLGGGLETGVEGSIGRGLRRLTRTRPKPVEAGPAGVLPADLVALYAGDRLADASAIFTTGPATTARLEVRSHEPKAGRGGRPSAFLVDDARFEEPRSPERADLDGAQDRRIRRMLTTAHVRPGDRVLEWPSAGGAAAITAAAAGASSAVLALADDHAANVQARARAAGLGAAVRVLRTDDPVPAPRDFHHDYDAILSAEALEVHGDAALVRWLRNADRVLAPGGVIVLQIAVATDAYDDDAAAALDFLRSYIWPNLHYPTLESIRRTVDRETGLRIVGQSHFPGHWAATLGLWRQNFAARARDAAALGYDQVYRRLWDYQLSLRQALANTGRLDLAQLEIIPVAKNRK